MRTDAAQPTKADLREGAPTQEPMRGQQPGVRRNPSTDQKKVRRQLKRKCAACAAPSDGCCGVCGCSLTSEAAVNRTSAEMLRKGDIVRLPNGQHITLKDNPRKHETSGQHVYIDTDIGTRPAHRYEQFDVLRGGGLDTRQTQPWRNPDNNDAPGNFNRGLDSERKVRRQGDPSSVNPPTNPNEYGPRGYRRVPIHVSTYHTVGGVSVIASRARTLAKEETQ